MGLDTNTPEGPRYDRWLAEIRANASGCEALRPLTRKPKQTGTISEAAALYLRGVLETVDPEVVVEVGTFIGTSALVLAALGARVYTCDKDNAAFPSQGTITCFQKTGSTEMLRELVATESGRVGLWFFDGRIQPHDLPLILQLSRHSAVYAFDDYEGREKGVVNVERLLPQLPRPYRLVQPPDQIGRLESRTTIALLVPR